MIKQKIFYFNQAQELIGIIINQDPFRHQYRRK